MKPALLLLALFTTLFCHAQIVDNVPCPAKPGNTPSFDWTQTSFACYLNTVTGNQIESPFHAVSLRNSNIEGFAQAAFKDYQVTDGWNAIQWDFGSPTQYIDHPYFVLYNKYTGLLRVFIAITNLPNSSNSAAITLRWRNATYRSALLSFYGPKTVVPDVQNFSANTPKITTNNYFSNSRPYWVYADFQMSFDPCSCNYNSDLLIEAHLASNSTLSFTLNGQILQDMDPYGRSGGSGGNSIDRFLGNISPKGKFWKNAEQAVDKITTVKSFVTNKNAKFDVFMPKLGKAMSAVNFLVGLFFPGTSPAALPMAFDLEAKAEGNITFEAPYKEIPLVVPGSRQDNIASSVLPKYNNVLGVFNLLKAPKVKINQSVEHIGTSYEEYGAFYFYRTTYRYEFMEDIKYIINPNAGISLDPNDIEVDVQLSQMGGWTSYGTGGGDELQHFEQDMPLAIPCAMVTKPVWSTNWEETPFGYYGHTLGDLRLKVIAKLKSLTGRTIVYMATYKVDYTLEGWDVTPVPPPIGCGGYFPMATDQEIKDVCNSSKYTNTVLQSAQLRTTSGARDNMAYSPSTNYPNVASSKQESSKSQSALSVSPNPSSGLTNIIMDITPEFADATELKVFNSLGAVVLTKRVPSQVGRVTVPVDLSDAGSGTYLIVLSSKQKQVSTKLVIKR